MVQWLRTVKPALMVFLALTILTGVIYPAVVTGLAQWWFPGQANGSAIQGKQADGSEVFYGSRLLAQPFTSPRYLIGRPAGVSNLSPVGGIERDLVAQRVAAWRGLDPGNTRDIPMDLVTASGSGVDPNISPEAAEYQVARIAKARGVPEDAVRAIVQKYTTGRLLGFIGEPAVNVLMVNLALDGRI